MGSVSKEKSIIGGISTNRDVTAEMIHGSGQFLRGGERQHYRLVVVGIHLDKHQPAGVVERGILVNRINPVPAVIKYHILLEQVAIAQQVSDRSGGKGNIVAAEHPGLGKPVEPAPELAQQVHHFRRTDNIEVDQVLEAPRQLEGTAHVSFPE